MRRTGTNTSKSVIRMKIDGIDIINRIATTYMLSLPDEIVRIGYDAPADTLYAHFEANAEAVDSEITPENDNIILGLNEQGNIVRITILNASTFQ